MPLAYYVDRFDPFLGPHWGPFGIHYYGLAYLLGFLTGAWLLYRYAQSGRSQVPAAQIPDLMVALVFGVLVGGRIGYYFLYDRWRDFPSDPFEILRVWDGGMASHGGMIGVTVALALFARSQKLPFLHLGDLVVTTAPLGLFFGRIANFINGELWGKVSDVKWAVIFPLSAPGRPDSLIPPRHPSQLYEAGLEGVLLFAYMQWRFWRTDIVRTQPGRLAGEFFLVYAILRVFGETFREPDVGVSLIFGLSRGTFYSLILVGIGLGLIANGRRQAAWPAGRR
jgi:phosphatidylglycerol:prolipoprotein diacylglycerol transferase